jgi:putative transposase
MHNEPRYDLVTKQARQLVWNLLDYAQDMAFLIHDNDKKFPSSFDTVFTSEGIEIVHTPYQAPKANAFSERWVRSVRKECLHHILISNENHLRRIIKEDGEYHNHAHPQRGIGQRFPLSSPERSTKGPIRRGEVQGGVIHN